MYTQEPRSRTVVTPDSSVFRAFSCARKAVTTGLRVPNCAQGRVPGARSQAKEMWVWASISPGIPV